MRYAFLFLIPLLLSACIGTDLVDEPLGQNLASLDIQPQTAALQIGDRLSPTVEFRDFSGQAATPQLEWWSSDETVAAVSTEGEITALAEGACTITARELSTDLTADLQLSVVADSSALAVIVLSSPNTSLPVGESLSLSAEGLNLAGETIALPNLSWSSSDPDIVSVDANGLATAEAPGTARITASSGMISGGLDLTVAGTQRSGNFQGANGYSASGSVVVSESAVELQNNFSTSSGPGLFLYLSNSSGSVSGGVSLGELQANSGAQSYPLPAGVGPDDYDFVIVYCQPFGVPFGFAQLD